MQSGRGDVPTSAPSVSAVSFTVRPCLCHLCCACICAIIDPHLALPSLLRLIGMLIGIAGNVMKQNAISPPPRDASMATEEESGRAGRNFIRGALLGIGATVLGVLLGGAPDYLAGTVKLPAILTEPGLLVSVSCWGSVTTNAPGLQQSC